MASAETRPYVVLYNQDENIVGGNEQDRLAAQDNLTSLQAVGEAIRALGPVELLEIAGGDPEHIARELKRLGPRVVFNLAEAARGVPVLEACVPAVLDLLGFPYSGSSPQTLALCVDKHKTKALLAGSGVLVPRGVLVRDPVRDPISGLTYPVIVKPGYQDASHGIEVDNVVHDEESARARAAALLRRFPPAVVIEEFITGREFNVSVVQLTPDGPPVVLPLSQIEWDVPPGVSRVLDYEAKWHKDSERYQKSPVRCPSELSPELARRVAEVSLKAFSAVSGRDYLRIDIIVDRNEQPYVLEVNPNPCLAPGAGLARSLSAAGWNYDEFIRRIVRNAEERGALAPLARPL